MLTNLTLWPSSKEGSSEEKTDPLPHFRPTVGLALGGGAARGWAHIGVIKALLETGIRPDIVCGTSMGSVVGGCYLANKLEELDAFSKELTKRKVFGLLDFAFGGSGLISGRKLSDLLAKRVGDIRIEDLDRPFVAISTELGTGHEIWIKSGSLAHAMRCSYALPGVFEPVRLGGRWLVDGALVNPIPVSACRALGARVVIAVNLNYDNFGRGTTVVHDVPPAPPNSPSDFENSREKSLGKAADKAMRRQFFGRKSRSLPGISGVMMESFNIIQDRIGRSRLAGDPPDVTLSMRLGHIGLFDFHRAKETIDVGYQTTIKSCPDILSLIDKIPS
ncbi:patatin-like phospholipase family protein [Flexibacterium corallicola]|uniref:patatin-like phospholipase family protein n=1 Tax=Flexibacterium corallicola TaxID=3037259 RepID=UPI00286EDD45|nr:patatin-like phospholipase family protein [Pseudovibrio sp. M1P-2-3]